MSEDTKAVPGDEQVQREIFDCLDDLFGLPGIEDLLADSKAVQESRDE